MSKVSVSIRNFNHHYCSAVILAAGNSQRLGKDKLMLDICGRPLLSMTLSAFQNSQAVDEIIVVTKAEKVEEIASLCKINCVSKVTKIIIGGANRTESALAGVSETNPKAKIICIHDGARPFVSQQIIDDAVHNAVLYHAAAPALPVKDTVKLTEEGTVSTTLPREKLFAVQTPQAFEANIIKAALTSAVSHQISYTDDCAAVEALGVKARLIPGNENNIKITTTFDVKLAEIIAEERKGECK